MTKPANILREINHSNGIAEIWVYAKPSGKMHSAPYPRLWGYLLNGVKFTSYKKALAAL